MSKPLFDKTARSAVEFGGTGSAIGEFGGDGLTARHRTQSVRYDLRLSRLPKRSRWRSILVIAVLLAAAVALGALTGCTSPHGPEMLPGTMPLPDGSRLAAFDTLAKPDKSGAGGDARDWRDPVRPGRPRQRCAVRGSAGAVGCRYQPGACGRGRRVDWRRGDLRRAHRARLEHGRERRLGNQSPRAAD